MQETLQKIVGYIPFGLEVQFDKSGRIIELSGMQKLNDETIVIFSAIGNAYERTNSNFKPLLLPLSALTENVEGIGVPIEVLTNYYNELIGTVKFLDWHDADGITIFGILEDESEISMPLCIYQKLYEWHFDIFGLIAEGKAIDKRTIKR